MQEQYIWLGGERVQCKHTARNPVKRDSRASAPKTNACVQSYLYPCGPIQTSSTTINNPTCPYTPPVKHAHIRVPASHRHQVRCSGVHIQPLALHQSCPGTGRGQVNEHIGAAVFSYKYINTVLTCQNEQQHAHLCPPAACQTRARRDPRTPPPSY